MALRYNVILAIIFCLLNCHFSYSEQLRNNGNNYVTGELIGDKEGFDISETQQLAYAHKVGVLLSIQPNWHIYWKNSGEVGLPTVVEWKASAGWELTDTRYPVPWKFTEIGNATTYGYKDSVLLWANIYPSSLEADNKEVSIEASVNFLACNKQCLPGRITLKKSFPTSSSQHFAFSKEYDKFEKARHATPIDIQQSKENIAIQLEELASPTNKVDGVIGLLTFTLHSSSNTGVQIFPYTNDLIRWGLPTIRRNEEDSINFVTMPYVLNSKDTDAVDKITLNGVVAFGENTENIDPVAVNWQYALTNDELSKLKQAILYTSNETDMPIIDNLVGIDGNLCTYRNVTIDTNEPNLLSKVDNKENITKTEEGQPTINTTNSDLTFTWAVILAFIAGIILNFMPCVLPVLALKLFSLMEIKAKKSKLAGIAAIGYTTGICFTMSILGSVSIAMKHAGKNIGWGFHFQSPNFVALLSITTFFFGLLSLDAYSINIKFINKLNETNAHTSFLIANFIDGIMIVLLSTPCTAPFLGSVTAFTFTQSWIVVLLVFISIGLGLSFPYCAIALNPILFSLIPKPGNWMKGLKTTMGFLLIATSIWLLFILNKLVDKGAIWLLVVVLLLLVLPHLFYAIKQTQRMRPVATMASLSVMIAVILGIGYVWPLVVEKHNQQKELAINNNELTSLTYDPNTWNSFKLKYKTIFLQFTADWCLSCKVNENLILNKQSIKEMFSRCGITPVKADWTSENENVYNLMQQYGGNGVPYYVALYNDGTWKKISEPIGTDIVNSFSCKSQ